MPPQPAERAPTLNAVAAEAVVTSRGSAVVVVAGVAIGAAHPIRVIAGPCSVEGPGSSTRPPSRCRLPARCCCEAAHQAADLALCFPGVGTAGARDHARRG